MLLEKILDLLKAEYEFDVTDVREIDDSTLIVDGREIMILPIDKANDLVGDLIVLQLLEYSNEFIAEHSKTNESVWVDLHPTDRLDKLKELNKLDDFIDSIIKNEGRGSYISSFDGKEWIIDDMVIYVLN